jgi:DNA-binding NarL/FixJ family response regulator
VLLVDDHTLFRAGLRLLLESWIVPPPLFVEAASLTEALACNGSVDVVLLDIHMPGISGLDGLEQLRARWPAAKMLMLSAHTHPQLIDQAARQGASFISKTATPQQIVESTRQALWPSHDPAPPARTNTDNDAAEQPTLHARQYAVLKLMAKGLSNKAIGQQLFVSENTVRNHVARLLRRFEAATRTEAVVIAQRNGWLLPPA